MGGDNNNYEYYGNVCTISVPSNPSSLTGRAASDQAAAAPTADSAVSADNTGYEYYGSANG